MHKEGNEDRCQHTESYTSSYDELSLPRNQRKLSERDLVLWIEEAAAFGEPVSGAAGWSFIFFGQVDFSFSGLRLALHEMGPNSACVGSMDTSQPPGISYLLPRRSTLEQGFAILSWMRQISIDPSRQKAAGAPKPYRSPGERAGIHAVHRDLPRQQIWPDNV
jgi:hypothetical protein